MNRDALDRAIDDFLRTAKAKPFVMVEEALGSVSEVQLVDLVRELQARTEPPTDIRAAPGSEREVFGLRRASLLGGPLARALRDRRCAETDALLLTLMDSPDTSTSQYAVGAALGCARIDATGGRWLPAEPPAREAVLLRIARELEPDARLLAAAVIADQLLGRTGAVERFAALDDGSAAFGERVTELLLLSYLHLPLTRAHVDLVLRRWATHAHLISEELEVRADPSLLVDLLALAPDERLDTAIAKGLGRRMDDVARERLVAFLAAAVPRAITPKLVKLAKGSATKATTSASEPAATMKSLGVVATDGGPVLLAAKSALTKWQGALPDLPPAGDYPDACAITSLGPLERAGSPILVLSSHQPQVEALDTGDGALVLVLAGDPDEVREQHATLGWRDTGLALDGTAGLVLLDAAYSLRRARADEGRLLALPKLRGSLVVERAETDTLEALRLRPAHRQ